MLYRYLELGLLYAQMIVGIPLNSYAFYRLFIKPPATIRQGQEVSRRFALLQKNLNLSDLLVLLLFLPHQIAMQYTNNVWNACATLCRLTKFWNNLAFHISSNIVVCIAVDRLISVYCRNSKISSLEMNKNDYGSFTNF